MTVRQSFCWFDRIILGAIFIGVMLVGWGMIKALEASTEAVIVAKSVSDKSDRNFNATTSAAEYKRESDQKRGNATIGLFLPVLLDVEEDIEQLKARHNVTRGQPDDLLVIDFNGSYLNINNQTSIFVPNFRELLGATNASGNADVLGDNGSSLTGIISGLNSTQ
jgi:hypothetical protein